MQQSPLFSFGSHSHKHSILNYLTDSQLKDNLVRSREVLTETCGVPMKMIAYPNGDYDDRVLAASREAGYELGFVLQNRFVQPGLDPMAIPRILVGGFDSVELLRFFVNRLLLKQLFKR